MANRKYEQRLRAESAEDTRRRILDAVFDLLGEREAADILYLLTTFDAFDALYTGRGLPADEVGRLLVATAERAVCR